MARVLRLFWDPNRGDNFTTATDQGEKDAEGAGYFFVRNEGYVYPSTQPNTVPLKLYFNSFRGDNFTTATADGDRDALASGYTFVRTEGYIYPTAQPDTVPLNQYWHSGRADNFCTATAQGEKDARDAGYQLVRTEGYISPRPAAVDIDWEDDMGANHYMSTHGVLLNTGHVDAATRTRTLTWFGGFHGAVQIFLEDLNGVVIGSTAPRIFGVDGTKIGRSDRTDYWSEELGANLGQRTTAIHVAHTWEAQYQAAKAAIDEGIRDAKTIAEIITTIVGLGGHAK